MCQGSRYTKSPSVRRVAVVSTWSGLILGGLLVAAIIPRTIVGEPRPYALGSFEKNDLAELGRFIGTGGCKGILLEPRE